MSELGAILLAAGGSSRLGRSKQLLELNGESLVRRAARLLGDLTPHVTVVTGSRREAVEGELAPLGLSLAHNERWREGVGSSISLGMERLPAEIRAVMVMLCDQYRLETEHLDRLAENWRSAPDRIVAARWADAFGPPVIFPRRFFVQLRRLRGDLGARQLLVEQRARVLFMDLPSAGYDVDDPADLERMRAYEEGLNGVGG